MKRLLLALAVSSSLAHGNEANDVFQTWIDNNGQGVYLGENVNQDEPCIFSIYEGDDDLEIAIHFQSDDVEKLFDGKRTQVKYTLATDRFRATDIQEVRLIERGTFFNRVEIPYDPETLEITELKVLAIFNKSYFDVCHGPFLKLD